MSGLSGHVHSDKIEDQQGTANECGCLRVTRQDWVCFDSQFRKTIREHRHCVQAANSTGLSVQIRQLGSQPSDLE